MYTDGGDKFEGKLPKELEGPFQQLRSIAQNVGEIMLKLVYSEFRKRCCREYVDTFRPDIMEVVYEWARGKVYRGLQDQ